MPQGTIKKLVTAKGFGFIAGDRGSDMFFHCSQVQDGSFESLAEGQTVEYEVGQGPRAHLREKVRPVR